MRPEPRAFEPYWEAAAEGRLVVPRDADGYFWPPRAGRSNDWEQVAPFGRVHSWIVNHRAFFPGFDTPYTNVAVDVVPGVRMLGTFTGDGEPAIGAPLEAVFTTVPEGFTLVNWRLR